MSTTKEKTPVGNTFQNLLSQNQKGALGHKASEKLREAITAVQDTGKMATVTVTMKIKALNDDQVTIEGDAKATLPSIPVPQGMMYVGKDGTLSLTDPRQKEFDLKEVPKPKEAQKAPQKAAAKSVQG